MPHLQALPGPLVEIRCVCPREVVEERYRARSETRHAGHLDDQRPQDELWNDYHLQPLGLGPLIQVDTSGAVNIPGLVNEVRELAAESAGANHEVSARQP